MYAQENGHYVYRQHGQVMFATPEVSVMFERSSGALVRHGPPERIGIIYDILRTSYREAGMGAAADDLAVMTGRFELDELNCMLTTHDYAGRYFARMQSAPQQPESPEDLAVFHASRSASPAADIVRESWQHPADAKD